MPEVCRYRVVHDLDDLHVFVVVRDGVRGDQVLGKVRDALTRTLVAAGPSPPKFEVMVVDSLRRDPGHGAKYYRHTRGLRSPRISLTGWCASVGGRWR